MPIFVDGQDPLDATQGRSIRAPTGQAAPDPFGAPTPDEVVAAAFRQYNPIAWAVGAVSEPKTDQTPVPGYDPIRLLVGTKYESLVRLSIADVNPAQTTARMVRYDRDVRDGEILAAAHAQGTVTIVAAVLADPIWLLLIWAVLRLWKRQSVFLSAKAEAAFTAFERGTFRLLIHAIVFVRRSWKGLALNSQSANERIREAIREAESRNKP
jgi:hypothetical protein